MKQTIAEKILARASGKEQVSPGDIVWAKPDLVQTMELQYPFFLKNLKDLKIDKIYDPTKVAIFIDHVIPVDSIEGAERNKRIKEFAKTHNITKLYEGCGISHQVVAEKGLARPGMLIVSDDTRSRTQGAFGAFGTCLELEVLMPLITGKIWMKVPESINATISGQVSKGVMSKDIILHIISDIKSDKADARALEFKGSVIENMDIDERMTICNVTSEVGAETGIINPDKKTIDYIKKRTSEPFNVLESDLDAEYIESFEYDVSNLEPQISFPPSPENAKPVSEATGIVINQAVIASCAAGRMDDLRIAAKVLRQGRVHDGVRMIISPGSQEVYLNALKAGLIEIFIKAGAVVTNAGCMPCYGKTGTLADGEVSIATITQNVPGRTGSRKSMIYLANAATVASSAIKGQITDPRIFL